MSEIKVDENVLVARVGTGSCGPKCSVRPTLRLPFRVF